MTKYNHTLVCHNPAMGDTITLRQNYMHLNRRRKRGRRHTNQALAAHPEPLSIIFVNCDIDTVFIDCAKLHPDPETPEQPLPNSAKIQSLIINDGASNEDLLDDMGALRSFTSLRELKLSGCLSMACDGYQRLENFPLPLDFEEGGLVELVLTSMCLEYNRCQRYWWPKDYKEQVVLRKVELGVDMFVACISQGSLIQTHSLSLDYIQSNNSPYWEE
jgi:hypothetical protein